MRHWFGRSHAGWVLTRGDEVDDGETGGTGFAAVITPGVPITLWDAQLGGTQITDLLDGDGDPVGSSISADADGNIPRFQGPDGTTYLWASASADGSASRYVMPAVDLGDAVGDLDTRVEVLEADGVGSAVPETQRWTAATLTSTQVSSAVASRAYNLVGASQTITAVHASAQVAPSTEDLEFDVRVDGTTIFSDPADRPIVLATNNSSGVLSSGFSGSLPSGSYVTVVPVQGDPDAAGITVEVRVV